MILAPDINIHTYLLIYTIATATVPESYLSGIQKVD